MSSLPQDSELQDAQTPVRMNEGLETEVTDTTILLRWDFPIDKNSFEYFEFKYRMCEIESKFKIKNIKMTIEHELMLFNLKSFQEYLVRGFVIESGERKKIIDKIIKTKLGLIDDIIMKSTKISENPPIYQLPCNVNELEKDCLRECHISLDNKIPTSIKGKSDEKTILMLGATGAGKRTLINAMINYVVNVSFNDECRFKISNLTDKEILHVVKCPQTPSMTSTTTTFKIPMRKEFRINFPLHIIETPGFNDTRGDCFDNNILIQIRKLFESVVNNLHAVFIVVPLGNSRLTEANKLVYDNILSLFGANIKDIIYPCLTFDDGGEAKCLVALRDANIPFTKHFRFNNSDLFSPNPYEENWNRRTANLNDLFSEISQVKPQCLDLSETVLKTRETYKNKLERIREKIRVEVQTVRTINNEERILQKYESEIQTNKDFSYEEFVSKTVKQKSKNRSVNCTICQESCHKSCLVPFDSLLNFCEVFSSGKCTVCRNRCETSKHERTDFQYEIYFVNEKRTKEDLEKKYKDALIGKMKQTTMVENEKKKLRIAFQELRSMLEDVNDLVASLNEIALKTEHFSTEEYLNDLIELENSKQEFDFLARIDFISKLKTTLKDKTPLEKVMSELSI